MGEKKGNAVSFVAGDFYLLSGFVSCGFILLPFSLSTQDGVCEI